MYPYLYLFSRPVSLYAVCAGVGAIVALLFADSLAARRGAHSFYMIETMLWGGLGAILGSHLLYALVNLNTLLWLLTHLGQMDSFQTFVAHIVSIFGGAVFYGGLFGGLAAGFLAVRRRGYPRALFADVAACAIPLFHGFARIGCFFGGCCYGIPSSFGFTFTASPVESANGVNRFPVALLESAFNFCLFAVLLALFARKKQRGRLLPIYLIAYGVGRFLIEFLRGDDALRGVWFALSTSQWIALISASAAAVWLITHRVLHANTPEKEADSHAIV